MKSLFSMTEVVLFPEHFASGTVYKPVNMQAIYLEKLMKREIRDEDLHLIEEAGFIISFPNGQPIPFPKDAYKRKPFHRAKHIDDRI